MMNLFYIGVPDDGHILLSSRRLSEITKINRQSGKIIWRLGGANNQFKFVILKLLQNLEHQGYQFEAAE